MYCSRLCYLHLPSISKDCAGLVSYRASRDCTASLIYDSRKVCGGLVPSD